MKTNTIKLLAFTFSIVASAFLSSCDDDGEKPSADAGKQQREYTAKVLGLRENLNFINRFVSTNVDPGSDNGRVADVKESISRLRKSASCAAAIEEELPDGSIRVELDFAEGCENEEGIEVKGKVLMIFRVTESNFSFDIEFFNYQELNGENQGEVVNGTVEGDFTFDFESSEFLQEIVQDLTIAYDNNTEAVLRNTQRMELTEAGMRVTALTTQGTLADGSDFKTSLREALAFDYSCESTLPVEGEESITFEGVTMILNYGNGTCDEDYTVR